jgi:hypothetical protein
MANGSYSGESPDPYGSAAEVPFAAHETFAQGDLDDNQHAGVGPYAGGATRSCAAAVPQMLRRKIALRAWPIAVSLNKTASRILQDEIERRLSRGHCPPVELLTEQAIRAVYGE